VGPPSFEQTNFQVDGSVVGNQADVSTRLATTDRHIDKEEIRRAVSRVPLGVTGQQGGLVSRLGSPGNLPHPCALLLETETHSDCRSRHNADRASAFSPIAAVFRASAELTSSNVQ
jgi:hypothetical protein